MKVLLQRVSRASVSVNRENVGDIGKGIVALVGVANGDSEKDIDYLVQKVLNLRIFEDNEGKLNLSLIDIKGELLVVSQFTLLADARKGRRPSFIDSAPPDQAEPLIEKFIASAKSSGLNIACGRFRQHMLVEILNDGPVTIMLDSREKNLEIKS